MSDLRDGVRMLSRMEDDILCHISRMRASRLLQILLLLQNRGRMTSTGLARELEVTPRTILRDVDALTEAGLPMVVHAGFRGGIELGFDYRTRLTGLAADEAEALGVLLARPLDDLVPLGLAEAASRARRKLLESFPDGVRARAHEAARRFRFVSDGPSEPDPRLPALAAAVRERRIVRIQAYQPLERVIHPVALVCTATGWMMEDARRPDAPVPLASCGDINISAKTFPPAPAAGRS
jgi:predicted DNA-binding transcriptional regulator YafY